MPHTEYKVMLRLLDYAEAARQLSMPPGTLYSLVHRRRIPHIRLGPRLVRFRQEDLERWLQTQTVEEQGQG